MTRNDCPGHGRPVISRPENHPDREGSEGMDRLPPYLRFHPAVSSASYGSPAVRTFRPRLWVQSSQATPPAAAGTPAVSTAASKRGRPHGGNNHYDSDDEDEDDDDSPDDEDEEEDESDLRPLDCSRSHRRRCRRPAKLARHRRTCNDDDSSRSPFFRGRRQQLPPRKRDSLVKFARPLVTDVHTRPRTPPEDKPRLFYRAVDQARFREEYREEVRRRRIRLEMGGAATSEEEEEEEKESSSSQSDEEESDDNEEGGALPIDLLKDTAEKAAETMSGDTNNGTVVAKMPISKEREKGPDAKEVTDSSSSCEGSSNDEEEEDSD